MRRVLASGRFCVVVESSFCCQIGRDGDVRVVHADGADIDDVAFALDDVRHCELGERGNAENRANFSWKLAQRAFRRVDSPA